MNRYLTKSRFKLALECPTKLFYTGKKEYVNQSIDDPFLSALADGGFQVGELAKLYFPGGYEIDSLDYNQALARTNELLEKDQVIIYEAAIAYNNLFIRADILVKDGNDIELIEVKAKSTEGSSESNFFGKRGQIISDWKPYLYDIAFQKYVAINAFPDYNITAYLMLVDKNSVCPTDGLNQKFKIQRSENGRKYAFASSNITEEDISIPILSKVNVDGICELIYAGEDEKEMSNTGFSDRIIEYADNYSNDNRIKSNLTTSCKTCEFRASEIEIEQGLKSGYHQCFNEELGWEDKDFMEGNIFDIWNFRAANKFIQEGIFKITDLDESDINIKPDNKAGISSSERQWLQIEKVQNNDKAYWIDKENLSKEMESWTYPLHFIDFETSMPAIPFNKGRHPYEGIAFQFSHHIVYESGEIEHIGEYLNIESGVFPNYDFVRNLKNELEKDKGTIFKYSPHENTYLNMIYRQLIEDKDDILDREELCEFILTITENSKAVPEKHIGSRNMVDMLELVKRYYYDPQMKGSNSIKVVLPAILNSSKYLQDKYSKPIYGSVDGITSLNFKDWTWIRHEGQKVSDPYKLLPKMFADVSEKNIEIISLEEELNNGGAAMTAYARMQFEEMTDYERKEIQDALLKYCELDTLAMVMIYEGWKDMLNI